MFVFEVSGADNGSCHYAQNVNMAACKQIHVHTIWMRSKCATPKERTVCQPCADWFVGEKLADIAPRAPPAELENVREHILDVLFLFPGWRAGTLIVLRNVHVEVSGADSGSCHYERNHVHTIWMRNQCVTPKEREVCQPCADWFVGEKPADIALTTPPAESEHVRTLSRVGLVVHNLACIPSIHSDRIEPIS